MVSLYSGFVIWNAGSITSPNFVPKEIYPPALEVAQLTETVYATAAEAQAAINAHGGAKSYHAASAAGGLGSGVVGPAGGAAQSAIGTVTSSAASVSAFLAKLGTRDLWIRIAKVVSGLALIVVGVIQLTHVAKIVGPAAAKAAMVV